MRCFSASGSAASNKLGLTGEEALVNVADAVDWIAELRQAPDLSTLPIGRRVVVVGGGMTAVDAAVQSKRLGAEIVTMVYRRGIDDMKASAYERELAQTSGVTIRPWAKPIRMEAHEGTVSAVVFERTRLEDDGLVGTGEAFRVDADVVFTAIGQKGTLGIFGAELPELKDGKLLVDQQRRTSLKGVWAGGDCVAGGLDLTVSAVEDGKQASALDRRGPARLGEDEMVDLRTDFLGIKSPNPFWLASAPPTDRKTNVERAFRAGWGGVVWKTLGEAGPPIVNVSGARYGALHGPDRRLIAFNNIELITDRDLEINLAEIKEIKRAWPDRALVVSLMVPCDEDSWQKNPSPRRRDGMRRRRAQFRLSARDVRARHGLGGRPSARIYRDGHALVQGAHAHACHRQADAQHHRHPPPCESGQGRRRRRGLADQHDQFDHGHRSRRDGDR